MLYMKYVEDRELQLRAPSDIVGDNKKIFRLSDFQKNILSNEFHN